jgi:hypothetical protein
MRMRKLGELFGKSIEKRKTKLFDNLGSPKLKQSRLDIRESERRAVLAFNNTTGATNEE